jgi:hypothetical protein
LHSVRRGECKSSLEAISIKATSADTIIFAGCREYAAAADGVAVLTPCS